MRTLQPAVQPAIQDPIIMRKTCGCGRPSGPTGECAACRREHLSVQTKLTVNQPGDRYEQEADRIAGQIMRMPAPFQQSQVDAAAEDAGETLQVRPRTGQLKPLVQRAIDPEEDEEERIQAKELAGRTPIVTPQIQDQINSMRGGGQPLPEAAREFFEPRFGVDFGNVRIHRGPQAAQSAQQVQARAFTIGKHIVFNHGAYQPESAAGRRLIAHELTHVVQQTRDAAPQAVMRAPLPEGGLPPLSFASIYIAVLEMKFDAFFDGHLAELNLDYLRTLDSLVERKIEFYSDLARQQMADPTFKPPKGVPDLIFKNVVLEYREFKKERLNPFLETKERHHKAPKLVEPWVDAIQNKFGGQPIGCAIALTLEQTKQIINAKLTDKEIGYSDRGLLRFGYLDEQGAYEIIRRAIPEGKDDRELQHISLWRMVDKIRDRKTILPLQIANAFLTTGSGESADVTGLFTKIKSIDKEIVKAIALAGQKRVGATLFTSTKGLPANAMHDWFQKLSNPLHNANSVYSCYFKELED